MERKAVRDDVVQGRAGSGFGLFILQFFKIVQSGLLVVGDTDQVGRVGEVGGNSPLGR